MILAGILLIPAQSPELGLQTMQTRAKSSAPRGFSYALEVLTRKFLHQTIGAFGLGTLTWGKDTDEFEAREQIELFIEAGGTFFDTSLDFHPSSLKILQHGLQDKERDKVHLSLHLKVSPSRRELVQQIEHALDSLSVEYLDYVVIEPCLDFDAWLSISDEISRLYEARMFDALLFRNVPAWKSVRLQATLARNLYAGEHFDYSLLNPCSEEVFEQVRTQKQKIIATSSLASGVLTGKYRATIPADSRAASPHLGHITKRYFTALNSAIVEAADKAAQGMQVSTAAIALAWLLHQDIVGCAVVGPRTVAQLRGLLNESDFELPNAIFQALNDVAEIPYA